MLRLRLVLLLPLVATAGCDTDDPISCTDDFRSVGVEIVDEAGSPAEGLQPTVSNLRTGASQEPPRPAGTVGSLYTILDDGDRGFVRGSGDRIQFRAVGDGVVAEAEFVIGFDACHIRKLSGPEQIVAEAVAF